MTEDPKIGSRISLHLSRLDRCLEGGVGVVERECSCAAGESVLTRDLIYGLVPAVALARRAGSRIWLIGT